MQLTKKSVSALSALIVAFALALMGSGTAHAAGPVYVALGDSYSAGNGAGNYDSASGDCHRSFSAYPYLYKNAHGGSLIDNACSGAVTTDVTNSQMGGLSASTTLVSITIGGNDAGFANIMTTCVTSSDATCAAAVNSAENYAQTTLPGRLDATYNAIRSHAPNAHVVVLGYPHMYDTSAWICVGLSSADHSKINEGADVLDNVIAARAAAHGFTFGDVRPTFNGHELCSGDDYLHAIVISPSWESYHPTALGHSSGYYPVLNSKA